ncbi:unconventional myosin-IXAa isoform X1 [Leguminivora glycinivorella]|uniref:unconventional myosin-IXAa isoform X1 n=1 Tax=Leguminivora glycinivorella TaxID=1035111 RepID=UPI00200C9DAE|nr:unconventional myosin-IXAa isoform X1 [Leguminivora glycinivorella]
MLLPDQTYEGAPAPAPARLPALLRAHRVRPDFFCANRPRRSAHARDARKAVTEGAGGERRRRVRLSATQHDASSSNEAVHLQRRLLSLSSELVTLRNHLHVGANAPQTATGGASAAPTKPGTPQPAVPPRAPHLLPPPAPPVPLAAPPQLPTHPPAPPESRWRGGAAPPAPVAPAPTPTPTPPATSGAADVDDLIHLRGPLTEDAVVRALQARFYHNKFYTWIGPILVALNGYTDGSNALTLSAARAQRPELARLVHDAVRHQADTGYPQAIILSGVSGSGKTYASMVLLRRLFDVAGGGPETDAFKHLAAAFTVLRSLGAAATAANSHSSRIGHFIEVQVTDGALYRTKIHCYFLDQTRVVRPPPGERNYHIFYQLLAGLTAEERTALRLEGYAPQDLRYLASPAPRRPDPDDATRFLAWKTCLGILGIPFLDVVRVLAAVLLLGNVQFADGAEGAETAGDAELQAAAALLGVAAPALLRGLTTRAAARGRAAARAPATAAAAAAARDALAKALYCRTVATIVRRANSLKRLGSTLGTLSSDSNESVHNQDAASRRASTNGGRGRAGAKSMAVLNDAVRHATDGFVGILDMFGFEDAAPSRLEHLCANLCAETMQHFYNTHVFKSSAESCREEEVGAAALEVDYVDNVPCIDLVSSLRGGLLAALDAECAARGSPEQYVARVRAAHRGHPRLAEPRQAGAAAARRFAVRHYAGEVTYDASEFLDANRDAVPDELLAAFDTRACEFGFATHLFGAELKILAAAGGPSGGVFRASPTAAAADGGSTLTQDFHTRLDNLLRTLVHARPHFVRCLRANHAEAPMLFERQAVAKQVRALQILETAQLMASGYPHRMRFRAFGARYRALWRRGGGGGGGDSLERDAPGACAAVLRAVAAAAAPPAPASPAAVRWALGKRHVFLSEGMRQVLERMRRGRRQAAAECIQAAWRRHRARRAPAPPAPPRPRPAPIAGTPPPEPTDKCDPHLVSRTCSLFGLDLERPPPLPPSRAYTVAGGVKLGYPQQRAVLCEWNEGDAAGALRLRPGDVVIAVGAARRGHVHVQVGTRTVAVPHRVLAPPRAPPPRLQPPPPAPPPPQPASA